MTEHASWTDLINESVHTSDDVDIGDIEALNRDFIVVKRGLVNVHRYYVPMSRVDGWDGNVVWLKVPEDQVKNAYERDTVPDPHNYHYSNSPLADTDPMRKRVIHISKIPLKHKQDQPFVITPSGQEETRVFRCDLCGTSFSSEDELSSHASGH